MSEALSPAKIFQYVSGLQKQVAILTDLCKEIKDSYRLCSECGELKPNEFFHQKSTMCKKCKSINDRLRYREIKVR